MPTVGLRSKENEVFEVDMEVAKMSLTIKTILEELGTVEDYEILRMPRISSSTMKVVLDWAKYHVNKPIESDSDSDSDDNGVQRCRVDSWDKALLKTLDTASLFEVNMAANYLDIKGLMISTSKTIANMIKGKTPQQIRLVFNIRQEESD